METWLLLHAPTWLLGLIIVTLCVGISLGGVVLVRRSVELSELEEHHDVAGFILAVVGVVYAVLLAFVVVIAWQQFEDARTDVDREATVLTAMYRNADMLQSIGPDARPAIRRYVQLLVDREWDQMAKVHEQDPEADRALHAVWQAFRALEPRTKSDEAFYDEAVSSLDDATELRRERIATSGRELPQAMWGVLLIGAIISVGFTYFFGVSSFAAQALMVAALAALVGLVLALIMTLDLPFTGSVGVGPDAMSDALHEFTLISS
ncbi:MAG TPA: DUF4239 domain-containing protein [Solirubrobacter sp.]